MAADRDALQSAREVALNDVDLLLRLRMGQDEVAGESLIPAYGDAMLAPLALVGGVNDEIRRLGGQKVDVLSEVGVPWDIGCSQWGVPMGVQWREKISGGRR